MSEKKKNEKVLRDVDGFLAVVVLFAFAIIFLSEFAFAANPVGPDDFESVSNSSKGTVSPLIWNISGGNISKFNLTATIQNTRWKAFVGNMTGSFTLDDAGGSTIFDWTLSTVTGRIFATRNASTVNWTGVTCSNTTLMEQENGWLSHSNINDNISATFDDNSHNGFAVGSVTISANTCPTVSTYINNASQDVDFEEVVLVDNLNKTIYATILEEDVVGYDGQRYDFQMLVPENGSAAWTSSTGYYIYVELG